MQAKTKSIEKIISELQSQSSVTSKQLKAMFYLQKVIGPSKRGPVGRGDSKLISTILIDRVERQEISQLYHSIVDAAVQGVNLPVISPAAAEFIPAMLYRDIKRLSQEQHDRRKIIVVLSAFLWEHPRPRVLPSGGFCNAEMTGKSIR